MTATSVTSERNQPVPRKDPGLPYTLVTGEWTPVERAVVQRTMRAADPERFLIFTFPQLGGGSNVRYGWTVNATALADRIDRLAYQRGLTCADSLYITDEHVLSRRLGTVRVDEVRLPAVLAAVKDGVRAPESLAAEVRRLLEHAADDNGRPLGPGIPPWLGVGPTVVSVSPALTPRT